MLKPLGSGWLVAIDLKDLIFSTLDWDAGRGSHTVETLIALFREMGLLSFFSTDSLPTANQVRMAVVRWLQVGELDMRSDGTLYIPGSPDVPEIETYQGAWYVTGGGAIHGPYYSHGEALNVFASICPAISAGQLHS